MTVKRLLISHLFNPEKATLFQSVPAWSLTMATGFDDAYVVYLRDDGNRMSLPEAAERPVIACSTYGEARRIQRLLQRMAHECIIRFHGDVGGGD
jgi:hypothetical protein